VLVDLALHLLNFRWKQLELTDVFPLVPLNLFL
jgi:hypothetical protein